MFGLNLTDLFTGKGLAGMDMTQLPEAAKQFSNLLNLGEENLPKLVNFLAEKYKPGKTDGKNNIIMVSVLPTNTKVFVYMKEYALIDGKEVCVKTHDRWELIELLKGLKKYLPNVPTNS